VVPAKAPPYGSLVVSLDFELHWGLRDLLTADGPYRRNLLGGRAAVPRILAVFEQFEIAATWATIGFLFAGDRDELTDFFPAVRPVYHHSRFDPYREPIGRNEYEDPLHFGRSLLEIIRATPRQEIGSHTFSHFLCREEGQDASSFRADLESAQRIAFATLGLTLKSLVLPKNQFSPQYAKVIRTAGFRCYRGNQHGRIYAATDTRGAASKTIRAARLADAYIPVSPQRFPAWPDLRPHLGLIGIPATRFLRPYNPLLKPFDPLRSNRIRAGLRAAARNRQIYHLWWHPHNFGAYIDESVQFLLEILSEFRSLRDEYGFRSMSMAEAAELAEGMDSASHPVEVVGNRE
jgi:peptidoglycan/xylan/chitin deacetylase (PgdA/CDA1 family)